VHTRNGCGSSKAGGAPLKVRVIAAAFGAMDGAVAAGSLKRPRPDAAAAAAAATTAQGADGTEAVTSVKALRRRCALDGTDAVTSYKGLGGAKAGAKNQAKGGAQSGKCGAQQAQLLEALKLWVKPEAHDALANALEALARPPSAKKK